MVPFHLELELENRLVTLTAEQLDRLADEDGFIRFDVRSSERRAVIHVNMEDQPVSFTTAQDAEAYFEAVHYPETLPAFSTDDDFTADEVRLIAKTIRQYNRELHDRK
jgi:hypothetical protein